MSANPELVIRAHHLPIFRDAILLPLSEMVHEQASAIFKQKFVDLPYYTDVVGQDENHYSIRLEIALRRFVNCAKDTPIIISCGIKDDICRACAIGTHCNERMEMDSTYFLGLVRTNDRYKIRYNLTGRETISILSKDLKVALPKLSLR